MADVYAVFGTLLALGIVFPGMLTAWWLIFPETVRKASIRLERSPWKSLVLGATLAAPLAIVLAILFASPFSPIKFAGAVLLVGSLTTASLGVSGLASLMGRRIASRAAPELSPAAGFVRGALALELAAAFPVIGWFLVIPGVTVTCLGAAAFAALGWMPSGARSGESYPSPVASTEPEQSEEPALGPA